MVTPFSLKALVDISQHESLSKVMTDLVIGLDDLSTVSKMTLGTVEAFHTWKSANCAQQSLLHTGVASDLLSTALSNLPNLKAIHLRNFDSPTRYRDAGTGGRKWRSYGYSIDQLWSHTRNNQWGTLHDRIFQAVMSAIDRSSPRLEGLEVILRGRGTELSDEAFACFHVLGDGLARTLNSLTKLHLDVYGNAISGPFIGYTLPATAHDGSDVIDPATTNLRSFLGLTANVTWLRLNFHKPMPLNPLQKNRFMKWLSLEPDCALSPGQLGWNDMNPAPVALPLRRLDLGHILIDFHAFQNLVSKFSSLEELCLKVATIEVEDDDLYGNSDSDEDDCIWAKFIRGLPVSNPNLRRLTLSNLDEKYKTHNEPIVFFVIDQGGVPQSQWITTNVDQAELDQLADMTWTQSRYEEWSGHDDVSTDEDMRDADGPTNDDLGSDD